MSHAAHRRVLERWSHRPVRLRFVESFENFAQRAEHGSDWLDDCEQLGRAVAKRTRPRQGLLWARATREF